MNTYLYSKARKMMKMVKVVKSQPQTVKSKRDYFLF